jgi:hypothetical protein
MEIDVLGSHTLGVGCKTTMNFVNDTNASVKIKEGTMVGEAEIYEEICQDSGTYDIRTSQTCANDEHKLPAHLADMYNRSVLTELDEAEKRSTRQLLVEYQYIFSKHDLDLGCLTTVTHKINTEDHQPVKHKIRRTPLRFQDQEKQQLDKILQAGVIQPSSSDWASAPVLVRKKDMSMR